MEKLILLIEKKNHIDNKRQSLQNEMDEMKAAIDETSIKIADKMVEGGNTAQLEKTVEELSRQLVNKSNVLNNLNYKALEKIIGEIMDDLRASNNQVEDALQESRRIVSEAKESYNAAVSAERENRSKVIGQYNLLVHAVGHELNMVKFGVSLKEHKINDNEYLDDLLRIQTDGGQRRLTNS